MTPLTPLMSLGFVLAISMPVSADVNCHQQFLDCLQQHRSDCSTNCKDTPNQISDAQPPECNTEDVQLQVLNSIKCSDLFVCGSERDAFQKRINFLTEMRNKSGPAEAANVEYLLKIYTQLGDQVLPWMTDNNFVKFGARWPFNDRSGQCVGTAYFSNHGQEIRYIWFKGLEFIIDHKDDQRFPYLAEIWEKLIAGDITFGGSLGAIFTRVEEMTPSGGDVNYDITNPKHITYKIRKASGWGENLEYNSLSDALTMYYFVGQSYLHTIFPAPLRGHVDQKANRQQSPQTGDFRFGH